MPKQKSRKKKDGTNKNKKLQAMREKEPRAKPRGKPSATGQGIGEQLKDQTVQDRPWAYEPRVILRLLPNGLDSLTSRYSASVLLNDRN